MRLKMIFSPSEKTPKNGDAVAFRFGVYENGIWKSQKVFAIDGGNGANGEVLTNISTRCTKRTKWTGRFCPTRMAIILLGYEL
jgi:hypothetical protein